MNNKFIVVGSGIVGCVIARQIAEAGGKVTILEKRKHIGGNVYDYVDEYGIRVHLYGPHIFHTKIERVWNYVLKFSEFEDYNLVCGSVMDGKCVPTSFDFESIDTFFPNEAEKIKSHIQQEFGDRKSATVLELLDCDDTYVNKFAQFLYDKDYAPYTAKQWGIKPEEVDKSIFKRVPILFSYGSKYFDDPHQAMPKEGYTQLISNLINHSNILVKTGVEALDLISIENGRVCIKNENEEVTVIYTGAIDELFRCQYGRLPYRSLRFEWKHEGIDSFQEMPVVAYPQAEGYTRITEYKKLPYQNVRGTTYAVEYPLAYKQGETYEPYYPVPTEESAILYEKYKIQASKTRNLICCGRLADYKYYNMDQAIDRALEVADSIIRGMTK